MPKRWFPVLVRLNETQHRQLLALMNKKQINQQSVLRQALAQWAQAEGCANPPKQK